MHEVGIISSMLKKIERIMEQEELTHVEKIVIEVGELSGVVPHYMEECYPAAVYKTRFAETKLEMITIPGILRCDECGMEFNGYQHDLCCPACGNRQKHTPLTGRELLIKEIVGY
ncbi:MAG: hydrogenase maturation nickel metallochaperone HypA [Oscillospiraceae bacterium]|nr:hydrogenase maturation nickel metallochaperone HypA [Oscillospiraceae bacterium]